MTYLQLTYPGESHPLLDHFKTETFVNGIRDADVKLAVCASQKSSFAETVSFALAQETERIFSGPQMYKRKLDFSVEEEGDILKEMRSMKEAVFAGFERQVS